MLTISDLIQINSGISWEEYVSLSFSASGSSSLSLSHPLTSLEQFLFFNHFLAQQFLSLSNASLFVLLFGSMKKKKIPTQNNQMSMCVHFCMTPYQPVCMHMCNHVCFNVIPSTLDSQVNVYLYNLIQLYFFHLGTLL